MPGNPQEQVPERLLARQGAPMQQLSRQDSGHPADARAAANGQWPAVSPRPHRESMDVPSDSGKGSPVSKVKLPAVSSNSRNSSPARPWKPSAPGALSPGIAGTMPILPSTSPSPSNASPMLRHTLSARGAATAGVGAGGAAEHQGRLLSLQEDSQLLSSPRNELTLSQIFGGFPGSPGHSAVLQQQYGGSSNGGSSSSGFGPRAPSSGGAAGSYLGGLSREGTESPSRPRRVMSVPASQLDRLALQHATQQKAAAAAGTDSSTSSPRFHHPSSLAARVGHHPNFTNIALDVSAAAAAAGGPEGQLASTGPTPWSACDTPDSQSSPHSLLLESPSGSHQHAATRFKPKPRAPGSSSGGSNSSTPHSLACPGSTASTPQLQPHPPQSSRKAAKPPVALAGGPGVGLGGGAAAYVPALDCGSPLDSPRLAAAVAATGGCCDTPGSSGLRRARYSLSGGGLEPSSSLVGSLGSNSGSALLGTSLGRGSSGLMRSRSGLAGTDSSTPTSPLPNMPTRTPGSGGPVSTNPILAKLSVNPLTDGELTGLNMQIQMPTVVEGGFDGCFAPASAYSMPEHLSGAGSSGGRVSATGAARDSSSGCGGGVAPLLGGVREPSFNSTGAGGSSGLAGAGVRSPRGSNYTGVGEVGPGAAAAAAAAASRPGSGKQSGKLVNLLVQMVRSRDDTQLDSLLQDCKGNYRPNDRHPVTERTPLHEAVCLGSTSMVTLLLDAGSDPNIGHPKEGSPLLQAAAVGASDIVQLLVEAGADVAAVDVEGLTALHHACRSGHVDTARLLVSMGADLTARTHDNEAPMDLARKTVQLALCGAMSGGSGTSEPSPTSASRRSSIDPMGRTSASGAATAAAAAAATVQGSSHPNTPTGSSGGGAAVTRQLSGSSQSGTPRAAAAAAAAQAAAADFTARFAAAARGSLQAGGASTLGSTTGDGSFTFSCDSTSTTTSAVSSPARTAQRSSSCNGLTLSTSGSSNSGGGSSSAAGSSAGGFLTMRRASSSSSGGLMPMAPGLGGGGGGGLLALVGSGPISGGGSAVNSPNGLTLQHSGIAAGGLSGSSTPAGASGSHGSSGGGGLGIHPASAGFSTPPISPSSLADAGPTGMRRPSPPVMPSSLSGMRGRLPSGLSSDGGSTTGDGGGGSGLPSALPSAVSSVLDQHPEERAPTPPVLQLPDRLFSSTSVRKPRLRATSKAPPTVEDTGRRDMEGDDQGPPAAAAAAAGGSSGGGGGQPGSSCSSSQPTPVSGAGLLLSSNSAADLTAPTPHGASILSGAASSSFAAGSSGGGSGSNAGSSSRSAGEAGAQHLEGVLEGLTLRDIKPGDAPAKAAQVTGQQQQQQAEPPPLSPPAQQQQQAAAMPVFKFGLDPGSSSNMQEAAAAATAAAAAAAAAAFASSGQQQQQPVRDGGGLSSSSNAGSSGHDPLAQTFKLRLGDSGHRELQQVMQQQQPQAEAWLFQLPQQLQQHHLPQLQQQQQQAGSWRNPLDPRFPPLLQGQTPPDTPGGAAPAAAKAAAGGGSFTVLQPEELAAQQHQQQQHPQQPQQQQQQPQQQEEGHVWEAQGPQGQAVHWKRGELLGEGAYGQVYLGLNQETGELMAVKTLPLVGRRGSKELDTQLQELKQELQCYQHLSHTHIVGYIGNEFDTASNSLYIFLEYVPGGSIASMVQRFGRFSEELARKYTRQLLLGLEYLHNKQIVHRDLKGGNALVTRSGVVKLTDFGASKIMTNAGQTDACVSMRGSVFWMAPEVLKGKQYGRKADIWSLGCTVLEMLTAKHPWPDVENQYAGIWTVANSCTGPPRPPGLSAAANDFLDQCFKIDPQERSTASQLLQHPWVALPTSSNTTRTRAALSSDEGQG